MPRVLLTPRPVLLTKNRRVYPFGVVTSVKMTGWSAGVTAVFPAWVNLRAQKLLAE